MSLNPGDFPPLRPPKKPPKPPDPNHPSPPPPAVSITEEQDTVHREGFAAAVSKPPTKFIEISLFKSESSSSFQLSQEENAKLIQRLNIDPKQLFSIISTHEPTQLELEVIETLDLSTINLHEAIPICQGLRTRPIKQHSHQEFINLYRTAVQDSDDDIKSMLSHFGEVISISHKTFTANANSSNALKAMTNVKTGDRLVAMKLNSFLPTFGVLKTGKNLWSVSTHHQRSSPCLARK